MKDFIISIGVMFVANIYIIVPYWDKLKAFWLAEGKTIEQVSTPYNLLCVASYLAVGLATYFICFLIKKVISKGGEA